MSELENIKPVAFYRADWKGDMMFRKDNTVVIRKNEGDFTTGWIKPLYDELPEPQPQLTIPKSIADMLDAELNPLERESMLETFVLGINYLVLSDELMKFVLTGNNYHIISAYLAGKALGVDLVKVVEG